MSVPAAIAFFDFDDTLARGDSILPYLLYCIRRGLAPRRQLVKAAVAFLRWKLQPSSGRAAKETTLSFIKGRTVEEMDAIAMDFFREVQSKRVFKSCFKEIDNLRKNHVRIVVVSASSDVYMRALPHFLRVQDVICTECEVVDGRYTGKVGKNCKGEEKVRRIQQWLDEQGLCIDKERSSGYGDSPSDAPMLLLTASPVLVNPKRKLRNAIPGGRVVHWE